MFESIRDAGSQGISRLWQRIRPGALASALSTVLHDLRFSDGQGQLWPLRVLTSDEKLSKPLKAAGCSVVVAQSAAQSPVGIAVDALCVLLKQRDQLDDLTALLATVRSDGMVVLCSRSGQLPRELLSATLLHAGLIDVTQISAGRHLLTAGRVQPRLPCDRGPRDGVKQKPEQ